MNFSGISVKYFINFYKIPINNVIVIHDELDLLPGKIRIKIGGSHAGHNGLKSIDFHCGNQYRRIRIGIGCPDNKYQVPKYVMDNFSLVEQEKIFNNLLQSISTEFLYLLNGDFDRFKNLVQKNE